MHAVAVNPDTRERMEVLADPAAMQIWQALLRVDMTGSQLAAHVGKSTQGTAWHMREMERVGLVTTGDDGSVTSRTWRAAPVRLEWGDAEEARDERVIRMFERSLLEFREQGERRWVAEKHAGEWATSWSEAEISDDYRLLLDADQLDELRREVGEVLRKYKEVTPQEGSEHVTVVITGHPLRVGGSRGA